MSEAVPEPTPNPTPEPAQDAGWAEAFEGLTPAEVKEALENSRKWESRSKANKAALDELTAKHELTAAEKSELATKLQTYEAEKERASLVSEVATAANVPASALRGTTREELEAHAAVLAELIKPSGPVIPGQERTPDKVTESPLREFTRNLFANSND
jgi:hypothetical protein